MLIGTETSPSGVFITWSISMPTMAIVLPSKRWTTSFGSAFSQPVHQTSEYVEVIGPWHARAVRAGGRHMGRREGDKEGNI